MTTDLLILQFIHHLQQTQRINSLPLLTLQLILFFVALVSDQVTIIILDAPTVFANINQLVCADAANAIISGSRTIATGSIWSTSGAGVFVDSSLLFTTYVPDTSDINTGVVVLTLTTTGNGLCKPVSDNMTIDIDPTPIVSAGFDRTVCASADTLTMAGSFSGADSIIWSTNGFGSFSGNVANAEYHVHSLDSSAGTIKIFARTRDITPLCNPVLDTITIVFTPSSYSKYFFYGGMYQWWRC